MEAIQEEAKLAKDLLNQGKFQEAEAKMAIVMRSAQDHFQDELAFGMAEFYYLYGCILVSKLSEQQDVFGQRVREAENQALGPEEQTEEESDATEEEEKAQERNNQGQAEAAPQVPQALLEELDDFRVAWENLEAARVILEKNLQQGGDFEDQQAMRNLAKVLVKLAELDQWNDKFAEAQENLEKALELRLKCENPQLSRDIAEVYFLLGNIILYNFKEGKEDVALNHYRNALQILENNLSAKLGQNMRESKLKLQDAYDKSHLRPNKEDQEAVIDLKQVAQVLYEKIEDVQLAMREIRSEEYQRVKKEMEQRAQQTQQSFPQREIQEERQVIQLGVFGTARRKLEAVPTGDQQDKENQEKQGEPTSQRRDEEHEQTGEQAQKKPRIE